MSRPPVGVFNPVNVMDTSGSASFISDDGSDDSGKRLKRRTSAHHSSFESPTKRSSSSPGSFPGVNLVVEEIVAHHFSKRYVLEQPDSTTPWRLPNPEHLFKSKQYQFTLLQSMKLELNDVKSLLNNKKLDNWHRHTKRTNKSGSVPYMLRQQYQVEFVTQAWCKFYECVASYPLIPGKCIESERFNSVHLCEAPGAFITSLNHFLKTNHPTVEWDWLATTLNPYYEGNSLGQMINDDRFVLATFPNWTFMSDNTGDLTSFTNVQSLCLQAERFAGGVHLVTADGSVDCQSNPGEQETNVAPLLYCEALTAMVLLEPQGSLLLKAFTFYESATVCLLYLLVHAFKHVRIFKPATSKEGNSECYIVCLGYEGRAVMKPWLECMKDNYGASLSEKQMFYMGDIPRSFVNLVHDIADSLRVSQSTVIQRNLALDRKWSRQEFYEINAVRSRVAEEFVLRYKIRNVPADQWVASHILRESKQMDPRGELDSSFNEMKSKETEPWARLMEIEEELEKEELVPVDFAFSDFCKIVTFSINMGRPVREVRNSKFCRGKFIRNWSQLREIAASCDLVKEAEEKEVDRCDPTSKIYAALKKKVSALSAGGDKPLASFMRMEEGNLDIISFAQDIVEALTESEETRKEIAFSQILGAVEGMWRCKSLLLWQYPMLTRLDVGLVYALSLMFKEVFFLELENGCGLMLHSFIHTLPKVMDVLQLVHAEGFGTEDATVLELLPVEDISREPFYSAILNYNHAQLGNKIKKGVDYLQKIVPSMH